MCARRVGNDGAVFKRVIWWSAGAVMGAGGSSWLQRKFRRTVQAKVAKLAPSAVAGRVSDRVRGIGTDVRGTVRSAVDEGRTAMRDRERELHAELSGHRPRGASPAARRATKPPATKPPDV